MPRLALALLLAGAPLRAQISSSDSSPFRALDLPTANDYRNGAGRPGPRYWQQRVDYRIDASLDPARNELRGHETIHYVNRSPDALPYLWMFLEQNMCEPNSVTNRLDQPPLVFQGTVFDFSCKGFAGGLTLERVRSLGRELPHEVSAPRCGWICPARSGPAQAIDLELGWRFPVPEYGGGRMGHDGTAL